MTTEDNPEPPFSTYICEYFHEGSWWGVEITARNWSDAEARAKKLNLQLKGELWMKVPAGVGADPFVRVLTWFRNRLGR